MVLKCIVGNGVACCSKVVVLKLLFLWLVQVALVEGVFSLSAGVVWWLELSVALVGLTFVGDLVTGCCRTV